MLQKFRTYELSVMMYRQCKGVQGSYALRDQLMRAALSVVLNVAEGSAKESPKDRRRFYGISLASLRECQAILELVNEAEIAILADRIGGCLYRLTHPKQA